MSRLLTHWVEVVGPEIASSARPVEVSYGRGFGATLTLLTSGAQAPMLEMQKDLIRDRVNACYGYAAISKIRLTQTSATGFSEGRPDFDHSRREEQSAPAKVPDSVREAATGVSDVDLRMALERLGANVLSHKKR